MARANRRTAEETKPRDAPAAVTPPRADVPDESAASDGAAAGRPHQRIDPAHRLATEPAEVQLAESIAATVGNDAPLPAAGPFDAPSPQMIEQLRLQAEQLASHLRAHQYQLDRREAQLNAREAAQENDRRSAALWLRERHQELADREAEVERRRLEIEREHAAWTETTGRQATAAAAGDESEIAALRESLQARQNELALLRQSLPDRRVQSSTAAAAALAQLETRRQNLEEAESLLADGQADLDRWRRQLAAERQAWQDQREAHRLRSSEERRRGEQELIQRSRALDEWARQTEEHAAAAEQLRADALRARREAIELRAAADEVYGRLSANIPPAALAQFLTQARSQLAGQFVAERAALAEQHARLQALAARLEARAASLRQHRQEIERWAGELQSRLQAQGAELAAQEEQLARAKRELDETAARQQSEKRLYEAEVRRLLGELRRREPAP